MTSLYRDLFSKSGTVSFAVADLLARIPLPMAGISMITLFSQRYGGFALAGAISATFVLTYALISPQISRYVDRYGQYRMLPVATAISVTGFLILIACSYWKGASWILFIGALLAGFMPSMSAMVRARWTSLYRGQPRLQTAYSLETVLDELSFIVGPPPLDWPFHRTLSPGGSAAHGTFAVYRRVCPGDTAWHGTSHYDVTLWQHWEGFGHSPGERTAVNTANGSDGRYCWDG